MFRAAFYKGTRLGLPGIYNRLVRWWTRSIYSHCELVFFDGRSASASFMDKGVRFTKIPFNPDHWDFVDLPLYLEVPARDWFMDHMGQPYDILGNIHFILSPIGHSKRKWFCSEAMAAALGFIDPHRYDPGTLFSALKALRQPPSNGFFTPPA